MKQLTKEEIFNSIIEYNHEAGESFEDHFGHNINEATFMTWCLGKRYINPLQYDYWTRDQSDMKLEATDLNYYLYNAEDQEDYLIYAVVHSVKWNDKDYERAIKILSEFISEISIYQKRFQNFMKESSWYKEK